MKDMERIISQLRRLNELEAKPLARWAAGLRDRERGVEIERARGGLPTSLLGHHDRLIARGMRSLARVEDGVCGACGKKLPSEHHRPEDGQSDLDLCDHCGVFLEWTAGEEAGDRPVRAGGRKPARGGH